MKILLLGKNGQIGWELQRALAPLGILVALDRTATAEGLCGDLTNVPALIATINQIRPDVVVNAAAYTAVDKAEQELALAEQINRDAVASMANACQQIDALLIHYSTDYVFDGSGSSAWSEADTTKPLNVYGKTKRDGEQAILDSGCKTLIFRTSWVYATRSNNFIKTMLRLAQEREQLNIIDDQCGAPTSAALIADVTAHALKAYADSERMAKTETDNQDKSGTNNLHSTAPQSGIYHLTAAGEISWYGYAQFIFEQARALGATLKVEQVNPIASSAYPTSAIRPLNSRLNLSKIQHAFHLTLPDWQQGVLHTLQALIEEKTGK
jgi:dTDP-4-dehydrorhamnose reductase